MGSAGDAAARPALNATPAICYEAPPMNTRTSNVAELISRINRNWTAIADDCAQVTRLIAVGSPTYTMPTLAATNSTTQTGTRTRRSTRSLTNRIARYLATNRGKTNAKTIASALGQPRRTMNVNAVLRRMAKAGQLKRAGRGMYAPTSAGATLQ
jgi:hypothetical protein